MAFPEWGNEFQQHMQHVLALGAAIREKPWVTDLAKSFAIAVASAMFGSWITVQVAMARLEERSEERYKASQRLRDQQIENRNAQIADVKASQAEMRSVLMNLVATQASHTAILTILVDYKAKRNDQGR